MSDDLLFCNGVNAATGDYALPPMDAAAFSRLVCEASREDPTITRWLASGHEYTNSDGLALIKGIDRRERAQTGWVVIFAHGVRPAALRSPERQGLT